MIWMMQPRSASWLIGQLDLPRVWPRFDSWWDFLPFYGTRTVNWDVFIKAKAIVRNPNMLGSYMQSAGLDVYLRLSRYRLVRIGSVHATEAHISGKSDTEIDAVLTMQDLDVWLLGELLSASIVHRGHVPILALGTASVDSFTLMTVGIKCKAVMEVNFLAAPYAQIKSTGDAGDNCQFTYHLALTQDSSLPRLSRKYLYKSLPRFPGRFPGVSTPINA